jgi:putative peptidoglycan lipid II flippase
VKIAVFTLIATQTMNLIFIGPLKHAGLALSIGLGACLNAGLLFFNLRKAGVYTPQPGWVAFMGKVAAALGVMVAALWLSMGSAESWLHQHGWVRVLHLAALVVVGAGSYFASLYVLGIRPEDFAKRAAE